MVRLKVQGDEIVGYIFVKILNPGNELVAEIEFVERLADCLVL